MNLSTPMKRAAAGVGAVATAGALSVGLGQGVSSADTVNFGTLPSTTTAMGYEGDCIVNVDMSVDDYAIWLHPQPAIPLPGGDVSDGCSTDLTVRWRNAFVGLGFQSQHVHIDTDGAPRAPIKIETPGTPKPNVDIVTVVASTPSMAGSTWRVTF